MLLTRRRLGGRVPGKALALVGVPFARPSSVVRFTSVPRSVVSAPTVVVPRFPAQRCPDGSDLTLIALRLVLGIGWRPVLLPSSGMDRLVHDDRINLQTGKWSKSIRGVKVWHNQAHEPFCLEIPPGSENTWSNGGLSRLSYQDTHSYNQAVHGLFDPFEDTKQYDRLPVVAPCVFAGLTSRRGLFGDKRWCNRNFRYQDLPNLRSRTKNGRYGSDRY